MYHHNRQPQRLWSYCCPCEFCPPHLHPPAAIVLRTTLKTLGNVPGPQFLLGEANCRLIFWELGEQARSQPHPSIHRCHAVPSCQMPCSLTFHFVLSHQRRRKKELRSKEEEQIFGAWRKRDKKTPCLADLVFWQTAPCCTFFAIPISDTQI